MQHSQLDRSPIHRYLEKLLADLRLIVGGEVASYIPELTHADPGWLGIAIVTVDGHVYQVGDARQPFTIQSISKAITYGLALQDRGIDAVLAKVGVEPSGEAFNSISLEPDSGRPLNPMINAGAIAITGLIATKDGRSPMERMLSTFARYTGAPVGIDEKVYRSESATGHRNRAISHLLYGHGIIDRAPEEVLDLYFRQCSILVTARDLALMAACLANNGVNPVTGVVALKSGFVEKVLSVMSTCGMYDYSGKWVFDVGMPAKSGVGGGIMAVLPGQLGLGVFSPPLDAKGNSLRGVEVCRRVSNDFGLHLFNVARSTSSTVIRATYDCAKFRSRRLRQPLEAEQLARDGSQIRIFELRGELMFGATESVTQQILRQLDEIEFLVLDFRRVFEIDPAATSILASLAEVLAVRGNRLLFTGAKEHYRFVRHLKGHGLDDRLRSLFAFDEIDRALEWCEDQILLRAGFEVGHASVRVENLGAQYLCSGFSDAELAFLQQAGIEVRFRAGQKICSLGDAAASFFFVIEGEVEAVVETDTQQSLRLSIMGAGTCFGEVSMLTDRRRSADIVAVQDTRCLEVPFDALQGSVRTKLVANLAAHLARKIVRDTELLQRIS
ncbi:MAG: glutaminase A [Porticoccaceae bacterium]